MNEAEVLLSEKGFMFLGNLSRKLEKYKLVGRKKR